MGNAAIMQEARCAIYEKTSVMADEVYPTKISSVLGTKYFETESDGVHFPITTAGVPKGSEGKIPSI